MRKKKQIRKIQPRLDRIIKKIGQIYPAILLGLAILCLAVLVNLPNMRKKSAPIAAEPKESFKFQWPFKQVQEEKKETYEDRSQIPWLQRLTLSHMQGSNFKNCFATNYSKADLLFAGQYIPGKFLPMLDLKGERFDDKTYAASGGIGARYIPQRGGPVERILGFNAYYDYRQGNIGYFNQVGLGIEVLSKRWDFRANGYIPFGGKRRVRECASNQQSAAWNRISRENDLVSYVFNAEVGWLMLDSQYLLLYLAGGPYYISGRNSHDKTVGGEVRFQPQYKDFLALDLSVRHDPLFGTVYQADVIVHLPLYLLSRKINRRETCGLTARQIYQPVVRYDTMPLGKAKCSF